MSPGLLSRVGRIYHYDLKLLQKNPHFQINQYICKKDIMAQTLPSKGLGTPIGPSFPQPGTVMASIGEKKKEEERYKQQRQDRLNQQFYQESVNAYDYGNQKVHANDRAYLDQGATSYIDPIKDGIKEGRTREELQQFEEGLYGVVQDNRQAESQFSQMNELAKGFQGLDYVNQGVWRKVYNDYFNTPIGLRPDMQKIVKANPEMFDIVKMSEMFVRDTLVEHDAQVETIGGVQYDTQITASPLFVRDPSTRRVAISKSDGKPILGDPMAFYEEMLRKDPNASVVFDDALRKARELNPRATMESVVQNVMGRMYDRFPTAVTSIDVRTKAAPGRRAAPAAEKKAAEKIKLFDKKSTQLDAVLAGDKDALTSLQTDIDPTKFKVDVSGDNITISKWVRPARLDPLWEVVETFDKNTDRDKFKLAIYGYFGTKARNTYAGLPEYIRGSQPAGEVDLGY